MIIVCSFSSFSTTLLITALGSSLIFWRSLIISLAFWYLIPGSFSIAFIINLLRLSGIFELICFGGTTSSCICFKAIVTGESASKGTFPVTISYNTTPREYRSVLLSTKVPLACSGEK